MFLSIYVDYYALYKPGFIDDILAGRVHEFAIGPTFVTLGLTLIAIPSLMILLSTTLPARVNCAANLVVASLYIPVMIYNAAGESWTYFSFYGLSIGLEVLLLALILRYAWTWPRTAPSATMATKTTTTTSISLRTWTTLRAGAQRSGPSFCPYSPECVEGEFSEVQIQDLA
jgi:hypothetical protein